MKLMAMSAFVKQLPDFSFTLPKKAEVMERFGRLMAEGKLTPLVDKTFPLAEAVAAIRYLESGRVRGKVVLTV